MQLCWRSERRAIQAEKIRLVTERCRGVRCATHSPSAVTWPAGPRTTDDGGGDGDATIPGSASPSSSLRQVPMAPSPFTLAHKYASLYVASSRLSSSFNAPSFVATIDHFDDDARVRFA